MNKSILVIILLLLVLFCLFKNKKLLGGQVGTDLEEVSISLEKKPVISTKKFFNSFKKKEEEEEEVEINLDDKIPSPQPLPKSIEKEYPVLKKQFEILKENYKELKNKYDRRGIDYKNLKNRYNRSEMNYRRLNDRYIKLNNNYSKLVKANANKIIQKYDYNKNEILDNKELHSAIMNNDI